MYIRKMGESTGARAAIYARISGDKKDDGDIPDGQNGLCHGLAEKYNLDVVVIYRALDGTGASEKSTANKRVESTRCSPLLGLVSSGTCLLTQVTG